MDHDEKAARKRRFFHIKVRSALSRPCSPDGNTTPGLVRHQMRPRPDEYHDDEWLYPRAGLRQVQIAKNDHLGAGCKLSLIEREPKQHGVRVPARPFSNFCPRRSPVATAVRPLPRECSTGRVMKKVVTEREAHRPVPGGRQREASAMPSPARAIMQH